MYLSKNKYEIGCSNLKEQTGQIVLRRKYKMILVRVHHNFCRQTYSERQKF
jgi:hypothetical protein